MSIATQTLSAVTRVFIVIAIAVAFVVGFTFAVYWSLRSSEVRVPDVVGKDRFVAEAELTGAGLNFRVRAVRPSSQMKADSIVFQLPRAGEVVKAGQTVAVDVSRPAKEGEASDAISHQDNANTKQSNENSGSNESSPSGNLNENKPKRKATNTNDNANGNANGANRNANSNRPRPNANANNGNVNDNTNQRSNSNAPDETNEQNSNRPNRNVNRATPAATPAATPTPPR